MTTRPDLDAIEKRLLYAAKLKDFSLHGNDAAALLTYCRELEEENKRLRERALAAEQVIHEELPS